MLDERAFVNGIVGLNATGGSTNLLIHLIAMARAAGIVLDWEDFAELSDATPLMARVYPNGLADVNHFHAAGGLGFMIGELLDAGLLHPDTRTVAGDGLARYTQEPKLIDGALVWDEGAGRVAERQDRPPGQRPVPADRRRPAAEGQPRHRGDEGLRRRPRAPRHRGAGRGSSTTRRR